MLEPSGNDAAMLCADADMDKYLPKTATLSPPTRARSAFHQTHLHPRDHVRRQKRRVDTRRYANQRRDARRRRRCAAAEWHAVGSTHRHRRVCTLTCGFEIGRRRLRARFATRGAWVLVHYVPIVDNPPEDSRVVREEFGPMVLLLTWSGEQDMFFRGSATHMGMGALVCSEGLERTERMARELEVV
ncbi:hypothetical protein BDU57DRAFT_510078 [Ampelomyces quisqualis]|uniref:Aldehyde dehydrogenase domain-containing protein n=1 Tax=Ampelomyces quisqualis TaxID=50730 RepID=A0A6A5R2F5_AMPQU|nr:hypothetical protein BDU57DRAFT_510078 [Ampelomyces quisqualis]